MSFPLRESMYEGREEEEEQEHRQVFCIEIHVVQHQVLDALWYDR